MIRLVLDGMHGTIQVKGKRYSSPPLPPMTGFRHLLNDKEMAAVLTYVRNSWTNRAKSVEPAKVASIRAIDRGENAAFWSANELLAIYPLEDGGVPIAETSVDGWVAKFVKEWKVEDFSKSQLEGGNRSFKQGQLAFQRLGCAQCHKLGKVGGVLGPNLAELETKKRNPEYVLRSIVHPSEDIEKKYAVKTYYLETGQVVSGFVAQETDSEIHVISDPLNQGKPTVVKKKEIEEQTKTATSIMPQGLLNWLQQDEVLDLVSYVLAGGDEDHEVYSR
jgi:putative heme-binding domain-containing protein